MELVQTIIMALLGAAIGSFLNVVIDRVPDGRSLVFPPSYCDGCQKRLGTLDLIPVFSYIILRGRCRSCGAHIPGRVLFTELVTGIFFGVMFWHEGPDLIFALSALYFCVFLALAIIDIEKGLILNRIVYPMAGVAFAASFFVPGIGPVNALIGGGIGFVILLIPAAINPAGMGFGDVKMAALMGLAVGFPVVFVAVLGGIIIGGVAAIGLLLLKIKKRRETIPFGPFLAVGAIIALIWGEQIMNWYLGLF